jgi:vacuolar-type H+-ATPase subunit B/Vma2
MEKRREGRVMAAVGVVAVLLVAGLPGLEGGRGLAQSGSQTAPATLPSIDGSTHGVPDTATARMQEKQVSAEEDMRRKRMLSDVDKLLVLATELKEEVDKSTKDEMSITAIKKATEMEKLAHDVKDRMRGY